MDKDKDKKMDKKRRTSNMLIPTIVMAVFAIILLYVGYSKGQGQHIIGLKIALKITAQIVPLLIFAFIMAGMIQTLLPRELISKWIGEESGGVWPAGDTHRHACRRHNSWWSLRKFTRCRWILACWSWSRNNGCFCDSLVIMGNQSFAHGNRDIGMEIYSCSPRLYLFLSPYCWPHSAAVFFRFQVNIHIDPSYAYICTVITHWAKICISDIV
jgi:hypothetical protein